eukprot:TRINITY_DN5910_c0_g1_i1.p1 TRINITY_DN5910_c0_g1~~TRINITY_DN5910_c0_g1_i1.p1  ORF type:complete len:403 (+),score=112.37 TRINITY_DN5910_c0_g1_i1:198-1406(+)
MIALSNIILSESSNETTTISASDEEFPPKGSRNSTPKKRKERANTEHLIPSSTTELQMELNRKRSRAKTCVVHGCSHDTARAERSEFGSRVRCGTQKQSDLKPHQVLCPVYLKYGTGTIGQFKQLQKNKQGLLLKMDELVELFNLSEGDWEHFATGLSELQKFWSSDPENARKKLRWKIALKHLQSVGHLDEAKAQAAADCKPPFTLMLPWNHSSDESNLKNKPTETLEPLEEFEKACNSLSKWAEERPDAERIQAIKAVQSAIHRLGEMFANMEEREEAKENQAKRKKLADGRELPPPNLPPIFGHPMVSAHPSNPNWYFPMRNAPEVIRFHQGFHHIPAIPQGGFPHPHFNRPMNYFPSAVRDLPREVFPLSDEKDSSTRSSSPMHAEGSSDEETEGETE